MEDTCLPHLSLLVLGEQGAVEVLQGQFGHGHPLTGVVAHGKGGCRPSRHGHTILGDSERRERVRERDREYLFTHTGKSSVAQIFPPESALLSMNGVVVLCKTQLVYVCIYIYIIDLYKYKYICKPSYLYSHIVIDTDKISHCL